MQQFPSLVEHGPLIWRALQVLVVALVLLAIWTLRRWLARRRLRAAVRGVRANHGAILGTLRGGSATTVSVDVGHAQGSASTRADRLWLDTGDRSIELVGAIEVRGGTRYQASRWRLPALAKDLRGALEPTLAKGRVSEAIAVTVSAGDQVFVRGTVESHAGAGEAMPRDADIAWTLRGDDGALQLAATRPVIARLPFGLLRTALVGGLALGLTTMVLSSWRDDWRRECSNSKFEDPTTPLVLDNAHACVRLASLPTDRADHLATLYDYLQAHRYRDDAAVARLDELAAEVESCEQRPATLLRGQRFEVALAEARRCGDRRVEHEALVALGLFDEAVSIAVLPSSGEPALPSLETLIAAGRWREASAILRATGSPDDLRRTCTADWFAHLGGDREALARVRAAAAVPESGCASVLDEAEPRPHPYPGIRVPEDLLVTPESPYDALELWTPNPEQPGLVARADRLRVRAVKQVLDNDTDGALTTAREVMVLAQQIRERGSIDDYEFTLRAPTALIPAIQLYTPTVLQGLTETLGIGATWKAEHSARATGEPLIPVVAKVDEFDLVRYPRLFVRSKEPLVNVKYLGEIAVAARAGKDLRVMEIIQSRQFARYKPADLLAAVPHLPAIRAQLARELPHSLPDTYWSGSYPVGRALDAFVIRELFEAVGATAAAQSWDVIYRRYDRMLGLPNRARALRLVR